MTRARIVCALGAVAAAAIVAGCGSQGVSVPQSDPTHKGAEIFATHCSGCHTLAVAGTIGSATKVRDRERVDGPNFNTRHETVDNVLYAIRNGGFSGAIMPENIVLGKDAQAVAQFVAKFAGRQAAKTSGP